jgi:hypothetical protein
MSIQSTSTDPYPAPQPARGVMAMRRYTNLRLAREIHYSVQRVSRVLNGYDKASQPFMEDTSRGLDLSIEELFRPGGRDGF